MYYELLLVSGEFKKNVSVTLAPLFTLFSCLRWFFYMKIYPGLFFPFTQQRQLLLCVWWTVTLILSFFALYFLPRSQLNVDFIWNTHTHRTHAVWVIAAITGQERLCLVLFYLQFYQASLTLRVFLFRVLFPSLLMVYIGLHRQFTSLGTPTELFSTFSLSLLLLCRRRICSNEW